MIILRIISSMSRYDWLPEIVGTISRLLIIPAIVLVIFNQTVRNTHILLGGRWIALSKHTI